MLGTLAPAHARGRLGLSGELNPAYSGKVINKIVVVAPTVVTYFRAQIEKRMVNWLHRLSNNGLVALRFDDLLSTFNRDPNMDVLGLMQAQKVDAIAVVDVQMDGDREAERLPKDLIGALTYSVNKAYRPVNYGKYRATTVTVYDTNNGKVIWKGEGSVNATLTSRKWHKKSGQYLAIRFAKYMRKAKLFVRTPDAPDPDDVHVIEDVKDANYTSGN